MGNNQINDPAARPTPRTRWVRVLLLYAIACIALVFVLFASTHGAASNVVTSAPSPRTSASEVDNADGSPVSGRDPAALSQRSLSETASRPGVFTTSITEPSDGMDDMQDMHDGQVGAPHSH